MLPPVYQWIVEGFEPEGDPWQMLQIARDLEQAGNLGGAASVYDRAFGIDPTLDPIREARAVLLDRLAVTEHGLLFRYVPAGPFVMGSRDGDPDEQPLHPVWLEAFWMAEAPMNWADHCRLMNWEAPPSGWPAEANLAQGFNQRQFDLNDRNKMRCHYCEDNPTSAGETAEESEEGAAGPDAPQTYNEKPMVAGSWHEGVELANRLTTPLVRYGLPTEAQWEKAARGGLICARYPWGDDPPTADRCDFDHYHEFCLRKTRSLPANGCGLLGMSGGVWEWTRDWYDRDAYKAAADRDPQGPAKGKQRVLRGGSWADCAEAVTVSFRMSLEVGKAGEEWGGCPMVGFRLCRANVKPGNP